MNKKKAPKGALSQQEMIMDWNEFFIYDLISGRIFNRVTRSGRAKAGEEAGTVQRDGYRRIFFRGKWHAAHRIAWDLNNPNDKLTSSDQIDHLDHNRINNRPLNLAKKSNAENHKNMSKQRNNKSGVTGVYWNAKERLWYAQIFNNNVKTHIGCFKTLLDAVAARRVAERDLGFHENHGK